MAVLHILVQFKPEVSICCKCPSFQALPFARDRSADGTYNGSDNSGSNGTYISSYPFSDICKRPLPRCPEEV